MPILTLYGPSSERPEGAIASHPAAFHSTPPKAEKSPLAALRGRQGEKRVHGSLAGAYEA